MFLASKKGTFLEVEIMQLFRGCEEVVQIHEAYEEAKSFFIVMEALDGGELFNRIIEKERLTEEVAIGVVSTVLKAIKAMHDKDIIHRDLKPENLLLVNKNVLPPVFRKK